MTRADAWPYLLVLAAGAAALWLAVASVTRQWAGRWAALRRQPRWLRWLAALALAWIGLRLARAGWRPLLAFLALLAILALWGELAARARR